MTLNSGIHAPTSRTFPEWWHNTSSLQYFWSISGKANLSHVIFDGVHIVTSSSLFTYVFFYPHVRSWTSVSSHGAGQHCQMTCGGMCDPVTARNVSTRGLTLGTMSFPSLTQHQPTWRPPLCIGEQRHKPQSNTTGHCLCSFPATKCRCSVLRVQEGIWGDPGQMPNATQTRVCAGQVSAGFLTTISQGASVNSQMSNCMSPYECWCSFIHLSGWVCGFIWLY